MPNVLVVYTPIQDGRRFRFFNSPAELVNDKTIPFHSAQISTIDEGLVSCEKILMKVLDAKLKAGDFKPLSQMLNRKKGSDKKPSDK